jgi:hypothetical protein
MVALLEEGLSIGPVEEVHHIPAAVPTAVVLESVEFVLLIPGNEVVFCGGEARISSNRTLF